MITLTGLTLEDFEALQVRVEAYKTIKRYMKANEEKIRALKKELANNNHIRIDIHSEKYGTSEWIEIDRQCCVEIISSIESWNKRLEEGLYKHTFTLKCDK